MILKIFHIQKVHRPTVYCLVNYIHVWAMKPVLFTTSSDISFLYINLNAYSVHTRKSYFDESIVKK